MDSSTYPYKIVLEAILQGLCLQPENVTVVRSTDSRGTLLTVHAAKTDMPRIIGKEGSMVKQIRSIIHAVGTLKSNEKVFVYISD